MIEISIITIVIPAQAGIQVVVNTSFVALNSHSWTPTLTGYQPALV